jgi:hypothetical protein
LFRPFHRAVLKENLFSFKAVATSALVCIAITGVAHVDFSQSTVIARAIVLTFGYTATDTAVYFTFIFIHHIKIPPLKVKAVCAKCFKIIDFFIKIL